MAIGYDRNTAARFAYPLIMFGFTYAQIWENEMTEHDRRIHELKEWGLWP